MKKQVAFKGRIVDGVIHYFNPMERQKALAEYEGKEIIERIEEFSGKVSDKQRAYYFATNRWIIRSCESFGGWTEEEIDSFARSMFLVEKKVKTTINHELEYNEIKSLKDTSKDEMREFIKSWLEWLSFNEGIYAPSPEDIQMTSNY